ncbi:MAG: flagellar basal body rod protein FlgC [Candidatus Margulisbacteria bacterium]|nr:flagellar basal body rod protein FlgC [Candidatus Margulisiibacteriota bacterium]MBU1021489.1 flagellar basal body rod protein FlgC [Candidatus Margulisiibacteriota bacterium]MBU1728574.1 flagellar basal body rod protein FlgC [Candidatus Margulisiibacteriota bacterium]MBU1955847.1 flagellar basal body rod protein FlgC [Candidatus Margulisiibacteriota bacterium]
MGLNQAFDISISGIEAARMKQEIIASNLANIDTTRTLEGGPYRRRMAVVNEKQIDFNQILAAEQRKLYGSKFPGGVEVSDIVEDTSPFQKVYKPGHPDADASGYVMLPNISMSEEMVDLVYVSRLYEANITAYNATKKMAQDTLQLP